MKSRTTLLLPAIPTSWLCALMLAPMLIVVIFGFLTRGPYGGVEWNYSVLNFARLWDPLYGRVFLNSLELSAITTALCILCGVPLALCIATSAPQWRLPLLILVIIPFWTNFVVRAYAVRFLIGPYGPINSTLMNLGLISEPLAMTATDGAVLFGMLINYLPFFVLPLFVAMDRFDFTLLDAAHDLGASRSRAFFGILIPNVKAGLVSGILFVFVPCLGEFVLPDILGGGRKMFLGNLITEQFLKTRDWPFGAAISLGLLLTAIAAFAIEQRLNRRAAR